MEAKAMASGTPMHTNNSADSGAQRSAGTWCSRRRAIMENMLSGNAAKHSAHRFASNKECGSGNDLT